MNNKPLFTPQTRALMVRLNETAKQIILERALSRLSPEERAAIVAQKKDELHAQNETRNMVGTWGSCVFKPEDLQ